jgi:hypothetical protein
MLPLFALQDVQLVLQGCAVLFTTVQLAQGMLLPYLTNESLDDGALDKTRPSNKFQGFCCIGCMSYT